MKYKTTNEFENFIFSEVHISDVSYSMGSFRISLDGVTILPENSCNRDIRQMRTNGLVLTLSSAEIVDFVEEGYKIYDADGNLTGTEEDIAVEEADYADTINNFLDAYAYIIEKSGPNSYTLVVDGNNERTYALVVSASQDTEEWNLFLQME